MGLDIHIEANGVEISYHRKIFTLKQAIPDHFDFDNGDTVEIDEDFINTLNKILLEEDFNDYDTENASEENIKALKKEITECRDKIQEALNSGKQVTFHANW